MVVQWAALQVTKCSERNESVPPPGHRPQMRPYHAHAWRLHPAEYLNQTWPIFSDLQLKTQEIRPRANVNIGMGPESLS